MKYETPELTASTPAINAIQSTSSKSPTALNVDSFNGSPINETVAGYTDWE